MAAGSRLMIEWCAVQPQGRFIHYEHLLSRSNHGTKMATIRYTRGSTSEGLISA
jgi:hypothetical protein